MTITKEGTVKNCVFQNKQLTNEVVKAFIKSKLLEKKGEWFPAVLNNSKVEAKINISFAIGARYLK